MRRLAHKEVSTCTFTTGLTSDLKIVSWSHLSGFLYSCWEFECWGGRKHYCLLHFKHSSHTFSTHFYTQKCVQTQYITPRPHGCLWTEPFLFCIPPAAEQFFLESLITSGYFCLCSSYHQRLKHCTETVLQAVNVLHACG